VPIWKKVYEDGEVWKENKEFFDTVGVDSNKKNHSCCRNKLRAAGEDKEPHAHHDTIPMELEGYVSNFALEN
jgi:hypothetical protein